MRLDSHRNIKGARKMSLKITSNVLQVMYIHIQQATDDSPSLLLLEVYHYHYHYVQVEEEVEVLFDCTTSITITIILCTIYHA